MSKQRRKKGNMKIASEVTVRQLEEIQEPTLMDFWERNHVALTTECMNKDMKYDYGKNQQGARKILIAEALVFWSLIRKNICHGWHFSSADGKLERLNFIRPFVTSRNSFVAVVAMIELMPVDIWRRLLWDCNIDFVSFESFLRRLEVVQFTAITNAYEQLTEEQLQSSSAHNHSGRHLSKSAMSYNLLNLDFGFNAYPNGESDDKKVVEVSPWRFLSVKNHSDDFVVNTEFGKYFRLYKSARSNYVWNDDEHVELKTHICPGFWVTFFLHFLFWVGSPALCIFLISAFISGAMVNIPMWVALPMMLPAVITPLWFFVACVKFIVLWSADLSRRSTENQLSNQSPDESEEEELYETILARRTSRLKRQKFYFQILGVAAILIASALIFFLFDAYVGRPEGFIASACFCLYLVYGLFFTKEVRLPHFKELPPHISIPLIVGGELLFVLLGYQYAIYLVVGLDFAVQFIAFLLLKLSTGVIWLVVTGLPSLIKAIASIIWTVGVVWLVLAVPAAVLGIIMYASAKVTIDAQIKINYLMERVARLLSYASVVFFGYIMWEGMINHGYDMQTYIAIAICSIMTIALSLVSLCVAKAKNPEIIEVIDELKTYKLNRPEYFGYESFLQKNWLKLIDKNQKKDLIRFVDQFAVSLFWDKEEAKAVRLIMRYADEAMIRKLEGTWDSFTEIPVRLRLQALKSMLIGKLEFADAAKKAKDADADSKRMIASILQFLKTMCFPVVKFWRALVWLGKGIVFCGTKIVEGVMTLKYLYELFNKRCPYVMKSKLLR